MSNNIKDNYDGFVKGNFIEIKGNLSFWNTLHDVLPYPSNNLIIWDKEVIHRPALASNENSKNHL